MCKRVTMDLSGRWASRLMASCTALEARTALSSCGRHAGNLMGCGDEPEQIKNEPLMYNEKNLQHYRIPCSWQVIHIVGGGFSMDCDNLMPSSQRWWYLTSTCRRIAMSCRIRVISNCYFAASIELIQCVSELKKLLRTIVYSNLSRGKQIWPR